MSRRFGITLPLLRCSLALCLTAICSFLYSATAHSEGLRTEPAQLKPIFDKLFDSPEGPPTLGASVAVVQNGKILFVKSYGKDGLNGAPVDPEQTTFYVASVAKTFAGLAIAQLIDDGLIDSLDAPLNNYVTRFQLDDNRGVPITFRHIMTHTAGYADRSHPKYGPGEEVPDFDKAYHEKRHPIYAEPAGVIASYSNYASGLVKVVVEDITGLTIDEYFQQNVFGPTGMDNSLVKTWLGDPPHGASSVEFYPNGDQTPVPNDWMQAPALITAGGMHVSGMDMARYMIGLMGGSTTLNIPALTSEKGRELMFSRQGGSHPAVTGFGTMFFVSEWNGVGLAEHTGLGPGYRASMTLMPELGIGIFATYTGTPAPPGPAEMVQSMIGVTPDRFKPADASAKPRPNPSNVLVRSTYLEALLGPYQRDEPIQTGVDLTEYAGSYAAIRRDPNSLGAFRSIFFGRTSALTVEPDGAGGLSINGEPGFKPIGNDAFYKDRSETRPGGTGWSDVYAFVRNENDEVAYATDLYAALGHYRVGLFENPAKISALLKVSILAVLLGLGVWLWRKSLGLPRWFTVMAAALPILAWIQPFTLFTALVDNVESIQFKYLYAKGTDFALFALFSNIVAATAIVVAGASLYFSIAGKHAGIGTIVGRIYLLLLAIAALSLTACYNSMNLIGWNLP